MYRDEVIKLMCDVVNNYNRQMVAANPDSGVSADQMEEFIQQGSEQMLYMNGLIYDTLKDHGIIN